MLIKLMKHEFRATGRIILPLYLVLLVTAVGANFTTRGLLSTQYKLLDVLGALLVMAFVVAIMGVCVMSMVVMVQRFYKNLLGDEGYVMMTLPVSVHQQIWAKIIVSTVWFAATLFMVMLACLVMAYDVGLVSQFFQALFDLFHQLTAYYALNGAALAVEFLALCFVGSAAMCLQFYAALAVGHSRPNHKMAWSVGCFFLFQFIMQMLVSALVIFADATGLDFFLSAQIIHLEGMAAMHAAMLVMIVSVALYGAVFYMVTTYFLKKHLNLE